MSHAHLPVINFPDIVDKLAYQLIFNNVDQSPPTTLEATIQNNIPSINYNNIYYVLIVIMKRGIIIMKI